MRDVGDEVDFLYGALIFGELLAGHQGISNEQYLTVVDRQDVINEVERVRIP